MTRFRLKIAASRPSLPHDATGEKMAAMQQHAAYRQDQVNARSIIIVARALAPRRITRPPAVCRRNSIQLIKTKNQDLNNGH
ncbi:hypothetical protein [Rhizobium sp. NPDC090279]|uniref:hypothetical protein n=1 Tax=Rhizobium sp. NPDC090279 TaxID=3364499 RepID=UPI00383A99A8